jgi:hypothetical protein
MSWTPYDLDHLAQGIVLKARERILEIEKSSRSEKDRNEKLKEARDALNQAFKMRANCAFGLERFWGEHLRLAKGEQEKENFSAAFVADVWRVFVVIMRDAEIKLPPDLLSSKASEVEIKKATNQIWSLGPQNRQVALAVLTNLCDSVVWWTQRLKPPKPPKDKRERA